MVIDLLIIVVILIIVMECVFQIDLKIEVMINLSVVMLVIITHIIIVTARVRINIVDIVVIDTLIKISDYSWYILVPDDEILIIVDDVIIVNHVNLVYHFLVHNGRKILVILNTTDWHVHLVSIRNAKIVVVVNVQIDLWRIFKNLEYFHVLNLNSLISLAVLVYVTYHLWMKVKIIARNIKANINVKIDYLT